MIKEEYLNELKEKLKSIDFGNNLIFLNNPITFLNDLDLEILQELQEFDIKNKKYKSSIFDKNMSNLFLTKKQTQDLNDFAHNNNLKTNEIKLNTSKSSNLEFIKNTSEPVVSRDVQIDAEGIKETKESVPNLEFVKNTSEPVVTRDIQIDAEGIKETKESVPNLEFIKNTSEPVVTRDVQTDAEGMKETKESVPSLEFIKNTSEKDDQNLNNLSFMNSMQDTSSYYLSKEEMKLIKDDISKNYKKNNTSTNILFDIKNRKIPTFKRGGSVNLNNSQGIKTVLMGEQNSPESFKFNKDSVNITPNGLVQSPTVATFINPNVEEMNSLKPEKIDPIYNEKSNVKKEIKEFFNLDQNVTLFDLTNRLKKINNKRSGSIVKDTKAAVPLRYPINIVNKSKNSCLIYNKFFDVK